MDIISLDDDIQEKITFLKMDIEGFEIPALLGAKRHIREDFPKLAICTYHIVTDMWEIPRLIDELHEGYRFYIRHYDYPQNWETVIYAIPPQPQKPSPVININEKGARKRIATILPGGSWINVMLTKDCGTIPYLMYKKHNCDAYMVGAKKGENYTNLKYVEGLKLEYLPDEEYITQIKYLQRESKIIDCLMLYGPYKPYFSMAECYKHYNPQGKIYLALDANSGWMDRIQWAEPDFQKFMEQCDIIATSGHAMQQHLNEKWPWPIEFIPNAFYDFTHERKPPVFENKENIILTISRLGSDQKATNVLLEAFVGIADKIPGWELRLVGNIDPAFEPYLTQFWEAHPDMKLRINFTGPIMDRKALYAEYDKAKIFALTSIFEGGTPNVIAEALFGGDAIAITMIDEYEDATDCGRCGMAAPIGNVPDFQDILLKLCQSENLLDYCRRAFQYAQESYVYERYIDKLYYMLFGCEGKNA